VFAFAAGDPDGLTNDNFNQDKSGASATAHLIFFCGGDPSMIATAASAE